MRIAARCLRSREEARPTTRRSRTTERSSSRCGAGPAYRPALHPSGARVAFYFADSAEKTRLGVCSVEGSPLLLDVPTEPASPSSRLVLRDEGIYLNTVPGDRSNVWLLPAGGGPARKLTAWDDQLLFDFAVSRDGSTLAAARGPRLRDAQRITGFDSIASPRK